MNEQLVGKWAGDIEIPNVSLMIIVDLQKESGTLSMPVQGLHEYPFKSITYDSDKVNIQIDLNGVEIKIDGVLNGEQIDATFKQSGGVFQLHLKKYVEEPVTYETVTVRVKNGDLKIALQKASEHPSPVALILAGSGPTNKDGNSIAGKNDSLKMLAEGLANEGIATVRYDKRGIGENMMLINMEEEISMEQFVDDAVQVIKTLKVDNAYTSVHIIGHSEGSLIGMLAAQQVQIDSFISLAGAGRAADEILLEQLEGQLPPTLKNETTSILASLKKGEFVENVSPELQALFRTSVQPYMISWLKYHPANIIETLEIPTLLIQGTTDIQINAADAETLKNAKEDAILLYVEGMNHILKNAPAERAANLATYVDPSLPLHEELLPAIRAFILD